MTCPISATILLLNEEDKTCRIFLSNEEYKMNRMTDFSKSFLQDLSHLSSRISVKLTLIDITTVIRYEQEVVKVQSHIYNFSCQFYKTQSSQFFFLTLTLFFLHFFSKTPADITTSIESQQPYDFKALLLIKMSGVFQQVNGYMKCPHLGRSL